MCQWPRTSTWVNCHDAWDLLSTGISRMKKPRRNFDRLGVGDAISAHAKAGTLTAAHATGEIVTGSQIQCHVLALDEPTSSLGETGPRLLFDTVSEFGRRAWHHLRLAPPAGDCRLADRVAILRDGKLVALRTGRQTTRTNWSGSWSGAT